MTWTEIITSGLRMIGQLGPGQSPSSTEAAQALLILNRMLNAWRAQRLNVPGVVRNFYTLTASQIELSFDGTPNARPARIDRAALTSDDGVTETPIAVLDHAQWSNGDDGVYFDGAAPAATLYIRPAASGNEELILYVWSPITAAITDPSDDVELPEGYEEAISYNLAVRLYMEWRKSPNVRGTDISDVRHEAARSLGMIKSFNAPKAILSCDPALTSRGGFDILRGDYR